MVDNPGRYAGVKESLRARPRTWLVTGAGGFIGSNLAELLLQLDQRVVALDNFSTGRRANVDDVMRSVGPERAARLRFIEGDIRDLDTCRRACQGVDLVLHQAALGSVPRSIDDPVATNASNVGGFLNMLVAARDERVSRFVYAASSSTYGDDPGLPKVEGQIGRPLSPYAVTKYVNELYADVFHRVYGMDCVGLRYFNVFGRRQDPEGAYAAVIPRWIGSLLRGEPCHVHGDGETTRDFCYVDNVLQANLLAATCEDPEALNQVYNVAFGDRTRLLDLYTIIRDSVARTVPAAAGAEPVLGEFRPGDVRHSHADVTKIRTRMGYEPTHGVREGLAETVEWYVAAARGQANGGAAAPSQPGDRRAHAAAGVRA